MKNWILTVCFLSASSLLANVVPALEQAWQYYLDGDLAASSAALEGVPSDEQTSERYKLLQVLSKENGKEQFIENASEAYHQQLSEGLLSKSLLSAELILVLDPTQLEVAQSYVESLLQLQQSYKAYGFLQQYLGSVDELPLGWTVVVDSSRLQAEMKRSLDLMDVDVQLENGQAEQALATLHMMALAFPQDPELLSRQVVGLCLTRQLDSAFSVFKRLVVTDFETARALLEHPFVRVRLLAQADVQDYVAASLGDAVLVQALETPVVIDEVSFSYVPPGVFSREDGSVVLSSGYWVSQHELSADQYAKLEELPLQNYQQDNLGELEAFEFPDFETWVAMADMNESAEPSLPVVNVSWADALRYCELLSRGSAFSYRLPTEEEWEYACRANSTRDYAFGDQATVHDANFSPKRNYGKHQAEREVMEQASFEPNVFGLYDMHGNVAEWTMSRWRLLDYGVTNESVRLAENGDRVVIKGGSWLQDQEGIKASSRLALDSDSHKLWLGFRLVIE